MKSPIIIINVVIFILAIILNISSYTIISRFQESRTYDFDEYKRKILVNQDIEELKDHVIEMAVLSDNEMKAYVDVIKSQNEAWVATLSGLGLLLLFNSRVIWKLKKQNKWDTNKTLESNYGKSSKILNINYNINSNERFEGFEVSVSLHTSA